MGRINLPGVEPGRPTQILAFIYQKLLTTTKRILSHSLTFTLTGVIVTLFGITQTTTNMFPEPPYNPATLNVTFPIVPIAITVFGICLILFGTLFHSLLKRVLD